VIEETRAFQQLELPFQIYLPARESEQIAAILQSQPLMLILGP